MKTIFSILFLSLTCAAIGIAQEVQEIKMKHICTNFLLYALHQEKFTMEWEQVLPTTQDRQTEATGEIRHVTSINFQGSVTDDTGYSIPLFCRDVDFDESTQTFYTELYNATDSPNGLKLHVKGELTFSATAEDDYTTTQPIKITPEDTRRMPHFNIKLSSIAPHVATDEDEDETEEDIWEAEVEEIEPEAPTYCICITAHPGEEAKAICERINGISLSGTEPDDWELDYYSDTEYVYTYNGKKDLSQGGSICVKILNKGQQYNCTIDEVVDLQHMP